MRSVYQPTLGSVPQPLTSKEPLLWRFGGECKGANAPFAEVEASIARDNAVDRLLAPLVEQARRPDTRLHYSPVGEFHHGSCRYRLPRFVFQGPPGGGTTIRLGLFAAIHGDEPEGATALRDFLLQLAHEPSLAQGYEIYAYPVCNPSGFEDNTRHSRAGYDLNREFWRGSNQPEVYYLERELGVHQFAGLVTLHCAATAEGVRASVRGLPLTKAIVEPALAAAAQFLPLASGRAEDGSAAHAASSPRHRDKRLSDSTELNPQPFEVVFETPQSFPCHRQVSAMQTALGAILYEYRQFIAYAQDL